MRGWQEKSPPLLAFPLLSTAVQPRARQAVFYLHLLCIATEHSGLCGMEC